MSGLVRISRFQCGVDEESGPRAALFGFGGGGVRHLACEGPEYL